MNWLKKTVGDAEAPQFSIIDILKKNIGGFREARSRAKVHASDSTKPGFCPRQWALMEKLKIEQKDEYVGTALGATFDVGNAVEGLLVNRWAATHLVGRWKCETCGNTTGKTNHLVKRPGNGCEAQGNCRWKYQQVSFESQDSGVIGSPDAIFDLGAQKYFLAECKIMKVEDFNDLMAPLPEHRIRTTLYMRLVAESGNPLKSQVSANHAKILYVSRGYGKKNLVEGAILPFKEYTVFRDDSVTVPVLAKAKQVKTFREFGKIPSGICATALDVKAKACQVCKQCFSGDFPAEQPILPK